MINLYLKWLPFEGELELVRYEEYEPPVGGKVAIEFGPPQDGGYIPPAGDAVALEFADVDEQPAGEDQYLFPVGYISGPSFGGAGIKLHTRYLTASSVPVTLTFGGQTVHNYWTFAKPQGIPSAKYGNTDIRNRNRYYAAGGIRSDVYGKPVIKNLREQIWPPGIAWRYERDRFGTSYIWNLLQRRYLRGFDASDYGIAYLRGGVKYIYAGAGLESGHGKPTVINSMADQFIEKAGGIDPGGIGRLRVSPRILYPAGIYGTKFSDPLVQFPPYPKGWESSRVGQHSIEYWTKLVFPAGISAAELVGYPKVFDPTQVVFAAPVLGAGIFGDILVVNRSLRIVVPGEDYFEGSDWAEVRSNRRAMELRGFIATEFGGTHVENGTPSLLPESIQPEPPSPVGIGFAVRYIYGSGWDETGTGKPALDRTPSIFPKWTEEDDKYGHPMVWRRIREFELDGFESLDMGQATVWFRYRGVSVPGRSHARYGEPVVNHGVRHIAVLGQAHHQVGRPKTENRDRTIFPVGYFREFEHVHTVGSTRWLKPFGFDELRFGTRIKPLSQSLYPQGFQEKHGMATVWNQTTVVTPPGFFTGTEPNDQWGDGLVYNLRQIIELYYFVESELNPPAWPRWTLVENRTKTIRTSGSAMDKFGYALAYHNARLLLPPGAEAPGEPDYYKAGMVAYRIRKLPVEGLEPPYLSSWSRIYNDAFVIAPVGYRADLFGVAEAEKTRRYFDRIGGFESELFGTPMIADRIRELTFEPRYGIAPPRISLHTVDLYTRYVDGIGEDLSSSGLPSLSIHFKKITTRWAHKELFGWADLRNLTPEVGTRGRAADEWGNALVRLEWRPVDPFGSGMELFGRTTIADRDRAVVIEGFDAWLFGDKLKVTKTGQPPYTDQFIDLDGEGFEGTDTRSQVPQPAMNQYVLYAEGFKGDRFGDPFLQSNAIIVDYGHKLKDEVGEPNVGLKLREVNAGEGPDGYAAGKPRVTPHTIWARPAPKQATDNHPPNAWRPINEWPNHPTGEIFGKPRVSTWRGLVRQHGINQSSVGTPRIQLLKRFIQVAGIRKPWVGWHKLGDGTQEVVQYAGSDGLAFGEHTLERGPYTGPRFLKTEAIPPSGLGRGRVEHLHREVQAKGSNMLRMGIRDSHGPYQYQGLAVHPPMPTIPEGVDTSLYGEPWVSPRVRGFVMEGFDAFVSEYELTAFDQRMRVRNAYIPTPPAQDLEPVGLDGEAAGVPNIKHGVHFITPDGNADQYRKGAF